MGEITEYFLSVPDSLYLTQCQVHSHCCKWQDFIYFESWRVFYCVYVLYFLYSLDCGYATLSALARLSRHRVNKKAPDLNFIIHLMGSTDTHKTFHPTAAKCTFSLSAWCVFWRIGYILDYKSHLSKPSKIKITPSTSSDYNNIKPTTSNRKNFGKFTDYMEIKQHILEQLMDHRRNKRKIKNYFETNKNTPYQSLRN